jgi:hypothetical protein
VLRKSQSIILIIPAVLGLIIMPFILKGMVGETPVNWEELALGKETHAPHVKLKSGMMAYAMADDRAIHCETLPGCVESFISAGVKPTVLWLGNSQLHAINQYHENDQLASEILYKKLRNIGLDLLTISHPSANLQEHYVIYEHVLQTLDLDTLVLGIVFDDFREEGVRTDIARVLTGQSLSAKLERTEVGSEIISDSQQVLDIYDEFAGLESTVQDDTERFFNEKLMNSTDLWYWRPYLRGLTFNALYKFRNNVFGINPSTKRKIIKPRFEKNWSALVEILKSASDSGIKVLVYVAPIRNDVDIPYVQQEYEDFKRGLDGLVASYGVSYLNLEDLVPPKFWGMKDSTDVDGAPELDFMHYQYGGHLMLADKLFDAYFSPEYSKALK